MAVEPAMRLIELPVKVPERVRSVISEEEVRERHFFREVYYRASIQENGEKYSVFVSSDLVDGGLIKALLLGYRVAARTNSDTASAVSS